MHKAVSLITPASPNSLNVSIPINILRVLKESNGPTKIAESKLIIDPENASKLRMGGRVSRPEIQIKWQLLLQVDVLMPSKSRKN